MKFKLDENIPEEAVEVIRDAGYDVRTVLDERLGGHPDSDLLRACVSEQRALVTLDVGFADIRAYPPAEHPGLMVLRLSTHAQPAVLHALQHALRARKDEQLTEHRWIVERMARCGHA